MSNLFSRLVARAQAAPTRGPAAFASPVADDVGFTEVVEERIAATPRSAWTPARAAATPEATLSAAPTRLPSSAGPARTLETHTASAPSEEPRAVQETIVVTTIPAERSVDAPIRPPPVERVQRVEQVRIERVSAEPATEPPPPLPRRAPAQPPPNRTGPAEPTVADVQIGEIVVRAVRPAPAPARQRVAAAAPRVSLQGYLQARKRR